MSLLTVAQLQARYPTSLADATLQDLIDDAERLLARWAGAYTVSSDGMPPIGVTETIRAAGSTVIRLLATVDHIDGVTEDDEDLVLDTDYVVDGDRLIRISDTLLRPVWGDLVVVEYHPEDTSASRRMTTADLVGLAITQQPGLIAMTIGSWSEQYAANSVMNREVQENMILQRYRESDGLS